MKVVHAYKLFRLRQDGTLGSLFVNRPAVVPVGRWLRADDHWKPGFAHRPGWHAVRRRVAPHLSRKGRVWARVELRGVQEQARTRHQGSTWFIASQMRVVEVMA